jgi:asparagine synthase (glutamine-hydrolysing)
MCGIAGYVGAQAHDPCRMEQMRAMLTALERRGPDSQGVETWPDAVLGHRRLAIIDLSPGGYQPMLSTDGQIGLVFNGCIYNFKELRRDLESLGHRFRSQCDTEALLEGYLQWGIDDLVLRLRGMYAFAIWDNRSRTLSLARDRLGVKPLVYAVDCNGLAFASTVGALRAAGLGGELDAQGVLEYFEFGFVTDQRSIFNGVKKLGAGSILVWRDGIVSQRRYWTLPEASERARVNFEDAVEQTESLLLESVQLRLQADVPVGALLSGGVDSALVCWALAKLHAGVRTFTVSTPTDPSDEAGAAAQTARSLGVPHETVDLGGDEGGTLEDLTEAFSEPFGCSSALGMLRVSKAVKPFATVLLTGDGGDDIFLGYREHPIFLNAQRLARVLPDFSPRIWSALRPMAASLGPLRRARHFLDYATNGLGAVTAVHDGLPYYDHRGMRGERLQDMTLNHRDLPGDIQSARRLLPDALNYEQQTRFVAEFMTKVDGGSMHYGLECRSPLLDQEIWEHAARLPLALRLRRGEKKAVLREIARRRIGPEVANRRKQGFTIPVERWLMERWRPLLQETSDDPLLERQGWLRKGGFREAVAESHLRRSAPTQLWYLLVLERWLRRDVSTQSAATTHRLLR